MTLTIKFANIHEFQEELKRMNIRHGPFRKTQRGYEVDILDAKNNYAYIYLKYGF